MFNMDEGFTIEDIGEHGSYIEKDNEEDDDLEEEYCAPPSEGFGGEENISK
jgi:hypothetical protein